MRFRRLDRGEGGANPDNQFVNLEGVAQYLPEQIDRFAGDLEHALARLAEKAAKL
ncbi:hypothetical protein HME9302_02068 [Alteripontixanthobacter maritimus]|uniref:Uncharacterized protein n=1 Tax=Alteripontixanthobacter maritimus TaxID=2161824 RepID=A0A369Q8P5_9SPHN|nr:hypothetical protein [Alteripontixanthobacter maritimus]RDC60852.1 hypothetical protein HME9302_02068 [Alteripontixanthobacter maritimus]